ncbi:MAG: peptidoglycan-binding protein [Clostridia bacterium]|nr:peptidoglycan-binding protein [Clostridia bacterium]
MPTLRFGSRGIYVELLQSTLKKLGFYFGEVDGIFGSQTRDAVYRFQREFGLVVDGIVGPRTWEKLMPYINGIVGSIVPTDMTYPYRILIMNLEALQRKYPFLETFYYGESVLGKRLPYIKLGNGSNTVFYSATIHANEWINSVVFMKFIEDFCDAYANNRNLRGYNVREIFENSTIYLAPMLNPDGVDLVTGVISQSIPAYRDAVEISRNYPRIPFPGGWKANIRGVDLNLQFPAEWEEARRVKFAQGFTIPAPRDFVGFGPLTEPEALSAYNFTLENNFRLILTYHTQGEVIFWRYLNYEPEEAERIGQQFANVSGYQLINEVETNSYAGYRDWFISAYRRPGYTVETGLGVNPLPISQFNTIYEDNIEILLLGAM